VDKELIKKGNAQRAAEVVRSIDPKGIVFSSSWAWLDKQLWPKESVQAYLDTFPGDSIQIWEQWNDQSASLGTTPMYKDLDYYFGKLSAMCGDILLECSIFYLREILLDQMVGTLSGMLLAIL
jgi:hypothetical protein